ncbi:MAG: Ppx/GppA phosphatase family protein [Thalassotalea sp.]
MTDHQQPTKLDNCLAALDMGSNSFHFVLARIVDDHLQILHSEKHDVRLADGLDKHDFLSQAAINRGLEALSSLASTTENLTNDNFKVLATYTLRQAKNSHQFLSQAAKIFPFDIEVISGHEEARLIYQGVSHYVEADVKRLVIDIGGGSTECIIGKNDKIAILDSVNMGCVSFNRCYFSDGEITKTAFEHAILHASLEIEAISSRFRKHRWKQALGTSGTIKSIYHIINAEHEFPQPITLVQLHALKEQMISAEHVNNLAFKSLKETRRTVICPGLAILIALMEVFAIKELEYCDYALREGVLFDQLSQKLDHDIYQRTINSLITRFNIDVEHIERVSHIANDIFQQVKEAWSLSGKHYQNLLKWAVALHEIGLDINPSGYHRHGRYIIENADFAGFNQEQVQALAWLVGNQRRKIQRPDDNKWFLIKPVKLASTLVILRLACLFSKQRVDFQSLAIKVVIKNDQLKCKLPKNWLIENPIIAAALSQEQDQLKILDIKLTITE